MQIDFANIIQDKEIASQCMAASVSLGREELKAAMAELALGHIETLAYVPDPASPLILKRFKKDKELSEWSAKSPAEKKEVYDKVYGREDVVAYQDEKMKRFGQNLSNVEWLERCILVWVEWGEPERGKKCWEVYKAYPDTLKIGESDVWKKKKKW